MPEERRLSFMEWPHLEVRPTIAYRGEPPAWGRHSRFVNAFYSFWFVESGSVRVRMPQDEMALQTSDWVLFPPHLQKRQDFSDGTVILSLGFEASWANGLPWMRFEQPIRGVLDENKEAIEAAVRLIQILPGGMTRGYRILSREEIDAVGYLDLHSGIYRFLARISSVLLRRGAESNPFSQGDLRIERILRELHRSPSIQPLPYARWRKEIGLSRVRIDRLAREQVSLTPKELRDRFLLAALKRVFLNRNASVKEAAVEFGFSDSSHLCRWFRRHAGVSPMDYRTVGTV